MLENNSRVITYLPGDTPERLIYHNAFNASKEAGIDSSLADAEMPQRDKMQTQYLYKETLGW